MILVDLNQIMISGIHAGIGNHTNVPVEVSMIRHMTLNSLRMWRSKFKGEFGELVLCADDKKSWRRDAFPYYKANRKPARDASELNWPQIFKHIDTVRQELVDVFPYKLILVPTAEGDDVIATLTHRFGTVLNSGEPILILSADKDFIQLHNYGNVKQFDPIRKRWITHNNPEAFLKEHIAAGDRVDGIPNVLSDDDTFVNSGKKSKKMTAGRLEALMTNGPANDEVARNWDRNKMMIDLSCVPETLKQQINNQFDQCIPASGSKMFNYMIANRLSVLSEHIQEFK